MPEFARDTTRLISGSRRTGTNGAQGIPAYQWHKFNSQTACTFNRATDSSEDSMTCRPSSKVRTASLTASRFVLLETIIKTLKCKMDIRVAQTTRRTQIPSRPKERITIDCKHVDLFEITIDSCRNASQAQSD